MKVTLQGDTGTLTELPGEPDWPISRLDRYTKPGTLFKRPEEVEIWRLPDGRLIRLGRTDPRGEWNVRWRRTEKASAGSRGRLS
ncbi:hypothetical protein [Deinococcus sp.]|uniref:hypothetical protein n=1 Tax=Deinococcus sp. TaxID=47478 RepID=UPI0025B7BDE0|nr:hypothetical protein [Deinococcus sp.]